MSKDKIKNVGLIMSSNSITAVEVKSGKKTPLVTNYSKVLLEEGIIEDGCIILNAEAFQEAVKKLLKGGVGGPMNAREVLVAIPEEKIFSHEVTIPKERIKDIDFIMDEARDFIPIDLSEATYDYKLARENAEEKTATLNFVAVQTSIVEPIIDALKKIHLDVTGIGIDINCLIRSFDNSLNNNDSDIVLLNMSMERDLIAVNTKSSHIHKMILKGNRRDQIEKIKALFNLPSTKEVGELLLQTKKGEGLSEAQKEDVKRTLAMYLEELGSKINQLVSIAGQYELVEIKIIYLTGIFSGLPGISEMVQAAFPEAEIKTKLDYVEIPDEIENDALEGIGLCIKEAINDQKNNFNLLPETKKVELSIAKLTPKLKIYSIIATVLFIALCGKLGMDSAKNYLNYKITSREVVITNEQTLNPYIADIAQRKEQTQKAQSQILSVIQDSLPVSSIIEEIEKYNKNGVTLVNLKYSDLSAEGTAQISMRAKVVSRAETEKFVKDLETQDLYSLVVSPLSNLLDRGERFVNLTLMLDKAYIIANLANAEEELRASAPEQEAETEELSAEPEAPETEAPETEEISIDENNPTFPAADVTEPAETDTAEDTITNEVPSTDE